MAVCGHRRGRLLGFSRGGRRHAPRRRRGRLLLRPLCRRLPSAPLVPSLGPNLCRTTRVIRPAWRGMAHLVSALRVSKGIAHRRRASGSDASVTPDSVARDLQLEKSVGMRPVPSRGGRVADLHGVATRRHGAVHYARACWTRRRAGREQRSDSNPAAEHGACWPWRRWDRTRKCTLGPA